jgi:hypothetical protein
VKTRVAAEPSRSESAIATEPRARAAAAAPSRAKLRVRLLDVMMYSGFEGKVATRVAATIGNDPDLAMIERHSRSRTRAPVYTTSAS